MASILLTVAGSVVGNALLPGIGGAVLGGVGAAVGHSIDNALFGSSVIKGPRLDSLKVQDSSYGNGIPVIYGTARVAGNVIWASDLIETLSSESVGGKGFGGSQVEKASYAVDCAIALGFGPVGAIRTIWADGKEVYAAGKWKAGTLWDAEFYLGTDDQTPSPLMEGALGAGNVPAYRGVAYIALHRLQLGNFGNRLPNFTFEVAASEAAPAPAWLGEVDPDLFGRVDDVANSDALPIVAAATRGGKTTRVVVSGATPSGGAYAITAVEYDVSGDAPVEIARTSSTFYDSAGASPQDMALCASPSGEKIVYSLQFGSVSPIVWVVYDVEARRFGDLCVDMLDTYQPLAPVAWLDEQRVVIPDKSGSLCGVRLYTVAGLGISPVGFFDVWGGAFSANRFVLHVASFVKIPGGLVCLAGNTASLPTILYARGLLWQDNRLQIGDEMVLSSSVNLASSAYFRLLDLGSGEWVLTRSHSDHIYLLSFLPAFDSMEVTRDWTTISISPTGFAVPNVAGDRLFFVYQAITGGAFSYGEIALDGGTFSLTLASTAISDSPLAASRTFFSPFSVDATRILLIETTLHDDFQRVALFEKSRSAENLSAVAADVLNRAGYTEEDYDLTALDNFSVDGYVIPDPTAARAALDPLQTAFGFDIVESDGILKARAYSAEADATIDTDEARAALEHDTPPPIVATLRAQELDLPREVSVTHIDPVLDYQKGSQFARRITGNAHAVQTINLPLVCAAEKAKEIAQAQLFGQWAAREQASFTLSRAYTALDPGDVVSVEGRLFRLTDLSAANGLIKINALSLDAASLGESVSSADGGQGVSRPGTEVVASTLFLMDLPLLRMEDDQPGLYVAVSGRSGWRGAALFRSQDGVTFLLNTSFSLPATAGVAASALADAPYAYMDRASSLTVGLLRGELASCSEAELLNGANAALAGDEIIQFQTAVLNSDGSYTLSNLLRGRRGTEGACATHMAGERFVLLSADTARFLPLTLSDRGRETLYRAPSTGQDVSEVANAPFTPALVTLAPFSPAHVTAARSGGGDLALGWVRRARTYGEWVDLIDVPLDEDSEAYDVDIYNGPAVVRTLSGLSSASASYSAADQITDFGSAQGSVSVAVYQISARYGRGRAARAVV